APGAAGGASAPAEVVSSEAAPAPEAAPEAAPPEAQAAPPVAAERDDALKAVVVTAQRREESAQSVPTPVSVLSGEGLTEAGIGRSAKEILDYVPNASAITQQHGRPRWWIRGVGTGQQQLDFANPVGFYSDDVYISNASATGFPLFDLDRVEVLRGPQGTLWGKNTTGGAINVISRKPEFEYDGYLKFDYGKYNDLIGEGAFGGTIWKGKLAARAAFHYEQIDGRFTNLVTGRQEGGFQDGAFRLQLLGKVSSAVEVLANVHVRRYTTGGNSWTVTGTGPDGEYLAGYIPSTKLDEVSANAPNSDEIGQVGALINLKAELGRYTLTSISGYEDFSNTTLGDSDNTPLEISRSWATAESYQLSEEIRLASPREDRYNWIVGVYSLFENIDRESSSAKLPDVALPAPGPANYSYTHFDHETRSVAAFASATLGITDAFKVTAGLRWTLENRQLVTLRQANAPTTPATFSNVGLWWEPGSVSLPLDTTYNTRLEKTWNNFTYDVTPQYEISKNALVYARYAHGVKSGGFNTAATTEAALNVVEPETLDDIELGLKTSFFGQRLILNLSAFHYWYSDIQVNVVGPLPPTNTPVSYLQNVEKGRVDGGELEFDSLPFRNLQLSGSLGLLDTEFTDFQVLNNGPDYSGNVFVRSPLVTGLLRGNYRLELPGDSGPSLLFGADYRWMSRQVHFTTNQDNPLLGTSPFSVLNARVSFESNDQKLLLTAYINNALNVKYRAHTLPATRDASGAAVTWSDPWTAGVSLTARWY
ncbi:MAG TPA: TonB-dependent receptor, partial [Polyangiaceae bacterium]|nr:TonB-dependent receptor [Polyangiaceae bacterium]